MLRDFLLDLLYSTTDGLATVGCPLRVAGKDVLIFAKLQIFLADGEGLAESLQWRGATAIKCCIQCDNVLSPGSDLADRARSNFVEATCDDSSQFRPTTVATLKKNVNMILAGRQRVGAGLMPKTTLVDLQKCTGLSVTVHGVFACAQLQKDVVSAISYDWVHNMLSGGTLVVEINGLVSLRSPGMSWAALQEMFSRDWCLPSFHSHRTLWQVFQSSAVSDKLKCSCSELLGIYAILRHIVTVVVKSLPPDNVASFLACCEIVDLILSVKASREEGEAKRRAPELLRSISKHLSLHKRAYGLALLIPKHHWMFHVAAQWKRDGIVADLFVIERLHLELKRTAEKLRTAEERYADSLLTMRCVTHCAEMRSGHRAIDRLLGASAALPSTLLAMTTARSMEANGVKISAGDVVISKMDMKVGVVTACLCYTNGGDLYCHVEEYEQTSRLSPHSTVWRPTALSRSWRAASIGLAKAWYRNSADRLVVLL